MSIWQVGIAIFYAVAIGVAAYGGRVAPVVWGIVVLNFAGSAYFAGNTNATGTVDAITIVLLMIEGTGLGYSLAGCFAVCLAISRFAVKLGLSEYSTAATVDFMIVPIALIIGCLNGDGGRLSGLFSAGGAVRSDLRSDVRHSLGSRGDAPLYLAPDQRVVASREVASGRG